MTLDLAISKNTTDSSKRPFVDGSSSRPMLTKEWRWVRLRNTNEIGYVAAGPQIGTGNVLVYIPIGKRRNKPLVMLRIIKNWKEEVEVLHE
jgi:hypothetical protein